MMKNDKTEKATATSKPGSKLNYSTLECQINAPLLINFEQIVFPPVMHFFDY